MSKKSLLQKSLNDNLKWVEMNIQDVIHGGVKTDLETLQTLLELKVSYVQELPEQSEQAYII